MVGFLLEKQFKRGKNNLKVFFDDMMMMMMMMMLKFVEHMLFHEKNSNNNLREERLPRFVIAWPLLQRIANNPLL